MKRRVRITKVPTKANGGQNGSADGLKRFMYGKNTKADGMNTFSEKPFTVNKSISAVPREESNLEAEGGEFAVVPGQGGIPESYTIQGPRHGAGGVPLDLDEGSFIYSDNKKGMKIKDKEILEEFGIKTNKKKKKHKGLTPAAIAKKYQINDFKKSLLDPKADRIEKETAEIMIKNYNDKLAKLALVQESMKGFPDGIPKVATPFMEMNGMDPNMFSEEQQQENPPMAAYGTGVVNNGIATYTMNNGGSAKRRVRVYQRGGEFKGAFWDSILQNGGEPLYAQDGIVVPPTEVPAPITQRATQYLFNKQGKIMNRREAAVLQNLEKQGQSGTDIYDMQFSKPFISGKEYGLGDDRFSFDAENYSGGLNYNKGDYNVVTIPAGQEDPHLNDFNNIKHANPADYTKFSDKFGKKFDKITFQNGGEAPKDYIKKPMYDMSSSTFDLSKLKEGDIIKQSNGTFGRYSKSGYGISYGGEDFDRVFAGKEHMGSAYAKLEAIFSDPHVRKAFLESTREQMKKDNVYKRKRNRKSNIKYTDAEIDAFTEEQIINNFLEMQKRNYALSANGIDGALFSDIDGTLGTKERFLKEFRESKNKSMTEQKALELYDDYTSKGYTSIKKASELLGLPIGDKESSRLQQATYWGYNNLLENKSSQPADVQEALIDFKAPVRGHSDEGQTGHDRISPIDGVYTDTTSKQMAMPAATVGEFESIDFGEPKEKPEFKHPEYVGPDEVSEPWLQDQLNMGNLISQRFNAKKYLPNSYPVNLETPNPVFYDPSRALAANAEQAGIAAQATRTFAGPQATSRLTGIMGEGVRNAANIVADYQGKNVGLANQFAMSNAGIRNQEEMANKQAALNLYNGNVIANQQYDNTIRQMDRNLTDGANQLITNMQETQAWNSLNPYYKVKPTIGGGLWKTDTKRPLIDNGRVPGGEYDSKLEQISRLQERYQNIDPKIIADIVGGNASASAYPSYKTMSKKDQEAQLAKAAYRG